MYQWSFFLAARSRRTLKSPRQSQQNSSKPFKALKSVIKASKATWDRWIKAQSTVIAETLHRATKDTILTHFDSTASSVAPKIFSCINFRTRIRLKETFFLQTCFRSAVIDIFDVFLYINDPNSLFKGLVGWLMHSKRDSLCNWYVLLNQRLLKAWRLDCLMFV